MINDILLYSFKTSYPVGIPEVHVINSPVNWICPEDNPYPLALLKIFVIPPRGLDIGILPVKVTNRLLFPTCIACSRLYPDGCVKEGYTCTHSDFQRGWVSNKLKYKFNHFKYLNIGVYMHIDRVECRSNGRVHRKKMLSRD